MKLAVVCALLAEAKPFISFYHLKKKQGSYPFLIYENELIVLIISKIGPYCTSSAIAYISALWPHESFSYLNLGIAGHKSLDLGALCIPSQVTHFSTKKTFYPALLLNIKAHIQPLYTLEAPSKEYFESTLVDMEAYEFFVSAMRYSTIEHLLSLKIVSDNQENPYTKLTGSVIYSLIDHQMEEIDRAISQLLHLRPASLPPFPIHSLYETISFSETEKIMLKNLIQRFQVLYPDKEIPLASLKKKQSAQAVLQELKQILNQSPLVFS